jgi:hypothetical protein
MIQENKYIIYFKKNYCLLIIVLDRNFLYSNSINNKKRNLKTNTKLEKTYKIYTKFRLNFLISKRSINIYVQIYIIIMIMITQRQDYNEIIKLLNNCLYINN